MTDLAALIERARQGDAIAFNHLVDRFQSLAFHVALTQLGDEDLALETCQEAMLSAWRAMDRFEGSEKRFRAWLMRVLINACRDRLRRERRRPTVPLAWERHGETHELPLPDPGEGPEAYAERADLRRLLEHAIAALSPKHREVVLLDQAGLDYAEIASTLGIERGTVKSRMSRAREQMRAVLAPRLAEPEPTARRSNAGRGDAPARPQDEP